MDYLQAVDDRLLQWIGSHDAPWLDAVMRGLTAIGERDALMTLVLGAGLVYFYCKLPRTSAIVLITALSSYLLMQTAKFAFDRPRPDVSWRKIALPANKSFPSGHALNTMADFGAIALTAARRMQRRAIRLLVLACAIGLSLLVGYSRSYLGVHYLSDVLAGWMIGLACAYAAYRADIRWGERRGVVYPVDHRTSHPHP